VENAYRAEQVGSLLRPPRLIEARTAFSDGRMTAEDLHRLEDEAILGALDMQRNAGIDVYTDGEYRRRMFLEVLRDAVEGFTTADRPVEWQVPGGGVEVVQQGAVVAGRLRAKARLAERQAAFLKDHSPGPFKITLPTPGQFMLGAYKPGITDRVYPTREEMTADLVTVLGDEMKTLAREGVPYIQMDAPSFTDFVDERYLARMREAGQDPGQILDEVLAASNACFDGARGKDVTLAIHLCRGNQRSRWLKEGSYDPIAEKVFNAVDVDRFLLEYDNERAGGFAPLRFVPPGKTVVLGLITTKTPELESIDDLLRRIEEASRYVPLEHLAISPQCGFASMMAGNMISQEEQQRKIELVARVARKVWG